MAYVLTPRAVLSFPHLFVAKPRTQAPGAEPYYSCSLLFDAAARKTPEWKALQDAYVEAAKAKFGDKVNLKSLVEYPFRDGALKEYAGYGPGVVYISAATKKSDDWPPPTIVDGRLQKVVDPAKVYSGAIVIAALNPYGWEFSGRKGVSFALVHLQIVDATAPRIDGSAPADKIFSPLEQLEDEDSPI
jgi:hypothetical protein